MDDLASDPRVDLLFRILLVILILLWPIVRDSTRPGWFFLLSAVVS